MKQQQCLVALILFCIATTAPAQTIEDRIVECAGENDHQQRLACFDTLARDVASRSGQVGQEHGQVPSVSTSNPTEPSRSPGTSGEKFGLEHKNKNAEWADELRAQDRDL